MKFKSVVKVALVNLLVVLAVLEIVLRTSYFDYLKTWSELNHIGYLSLIPDEIPDWYWVSVPHSLRTEQKPEFSFSHRFSSLGLNNPEIGLQKKKNTYRTLVLGDSFTEGAGAPSDSSWGRILEKLRNQTADTVNHEVINAGISGSDVFFSYVLLRDKLMLYQPDEIIYLMNASDILDIQLRGGMERFAPDSTVQWRVQNPWWEPVYARLYTLRALVHHFTTIDFSLRTQAKRNADQVFSHAS
ncbi:MAG: hypothetical protein IPH78_01265 [Bacteroidetes bacterium]|nr:hypothetical protein [Bacteroidota bacterium]